MKIVYVETNNKQSSTFKLHRPDGRSDYLFVLFKSPSKVFVGGEYVTTNKGYGMFFDKHKIQSYFPIKPNPFLHDYIHFDLENKYEEILFGNIPLDTLIPFPQPELITESFDNIIKEFFSAESKYHNDILSMLGHVFLYTVKNQLEQTENNKKYKLLCELRNNIYKSPANNWNIEDISKSVYMSRSYMQHLYKKFFGISCTKDIINARINTAKSLLLGTDLSISEIAEKCGYQNQTHFIRQFKENTNLSPNKYRHN